MLGMTEGQRRRGQQKMRWVDSITQSMDMNLSKLRETVEIVADFILGGSKITADGGCSHEIKRRLLLGRKVMTSLDSILKSRHYFANKGLSSQGYGFSSSHVWM